MTALVIYKISSESDFGELDLFFAIFFYGYPYKVASKKVSCLSKRHDFVGIPIILIARGEEGERVFAKAM